MPAAPSICRRVHRAGHHACGGRRSSAAASALGGPHPHGAQDELRPAFARFALGEPLLCGGGSGRGGDERVGLDGAIATAISVTRGVVIMPLLSRAGDERYA
jgi:hypothetical protein